METENGIIQAIAFIRTFPTLASYLNYYKDTHLHTMKLMSINKEKTDTEILNFAELQYNWKCNIAKVAIANGYKTS